MNTTKMWILTDGSDVGLSKLIGEAVREYIMEHQNSLVVKNQYLSSEERRKRRPVVIGVVDRKCLPEGVQLDGLVRKHI
ncbi:hypothetical protein DPMN_159512 [Dreissena polymorpha]|uniref:Uncharacterized protein n=1 Tax=Dreissena polymorpha TaxID=45954 RepID=A0A9D4IQS4_DREPO|nr:hypothetical protein DPMN_159512 [Dreissena polymorpha]